MNILEDVKEGDPVAVYSFGALSRRYAGRTTKTRVAIGGDQFMRRSGAKVGSGGGFYCRIRAERWTDKHDALLAEQKAENELARKRNMLNGFPWGRATSEQCDAVVAAMTDCGLLIAKTEAA